MNKKLAILSILLIGALFTSTTSAVVLYIDDWKNSTKHSYFFKKTESAHLGKLSGPNGKKGWSEKPKMNKYIEWHPHGKMHSTGYAIPWYNNGNSKFVLKRTHGKKIEFWVGGCGSKGYDCLHARNSGSLTYLKGFPTEIGPKGSCALSMAMKITKSGKIQFIHLSDQFFECATTIKWTEKMADALIQAGAGLADAF